jgi:hypothetical protein
MGPKKSGVSRTVLTIETKQYGLNSSTVGTILAKKDIIKKTQKAKGVSKITSDKQKVPSMTK